MSTDADRFREEAIAAEQEQDWDLWMARSLARLWEEAGCEGPWRDADGGNGLKSSEVCGILPNMEETRTEKISAMLTPAMLRELDAYAAEHHWSRSTAAAVLIEQGLSDKEQDQ